MNKQELIKKYENTCCTIISINGVLEDLRQLDEPQSMKLKDVIARIKGFDSGTRKVWLDGILGELGSEYGSLKYKQGYDQGKFEGGLAGVERAWNKPVVPQFVADWYEENKDDFETNLFQLIESLEVAPCEEDDLIDFISWLIDKDTKPFQTLVNMHQFGYTVEKEKRYIVKMKGLRENTSYLNYDSIDAEWYFADAENGPAVGTHCTRKELESAGFGWIFSCEGIEVEEVE